MLTEGQLRHLEELERAEPGDWCRGVWANSLLYGFNVGDEEERDAFVAANWRRLAGRRCEDVRRLAEEMRRSRAEQWQMRLSRFCKTAPVVRERRSA